MFLRYVDTPLGALALEADAEGLTAASFAPRNWKEQTCPLLEEAARQVEEWFAGARKAFALPLAVRGTPFQKAVWKQLQAIPWGEYRTYGEIARNLGKPGAARAVGNACGANPLVLIIPCHRVLARNGRLGGFSAGLELKKKLLQREGIHWQ